MILQHQRRNKNPEHLIQVQIVTILKRRQILFCASAGGMHTAKGTAIKMKRAGYIKGFPNLFIYEPTTRYIGMAIEVKADSGQSPFQREWQQALEERGYLYQLVKTPEEFEKILDKYLKDSIADIANAYIPKSIIKF